MESVMVSARNQDKGVAFDLINESMLMVNSAGPFARQLFFEWFWFSNSLER
jgi:hypothetical protein